MVPGRQTLIFSPKLTTRQAVGVHVAYFLKNCDLGGRLGPQKWPKNTTFWELRFPELKLRKSPPRKCDLHMIPHLLVFCQPLNDRFSIFDPPKSGLFSITLAFGFWFFQNNPLGRTNFFKTFQNRKRSIPPHAESSITYF